MVHLPESVMADILIRLPCKSCFRFKSVCKRWLNLMSEPYFIGKFIGHHKQIAQFSSGKYKQACTVVSESGDIIASVDDDPIFKLSRRFPLSFLPCYEADQDPPIRVVASCNDLLLCCPTSEYHEVYYICNLITKRWLKLPESTHRTRSCIKIGFLADPMSNKSNLAGFNYKVLRFLGSQEKVTTDDGLLLVEIYSSESREWSQVSAVYPPGHTWDPRRRTRPAFANRGMLYWGSLSPTNDLIVYDVLSNQFFSMEGPTDANSPPFGVMCHIGSCEGRIRVSYKSMWCGLTLRIWELDDVKRWRLVNIVENIKFTNDDKIAKQVRSVRWLIDFRTFIHPHDEDLIYLIFNRHVVLCNIRTMTMASLTQFRGFCVQDLFPLQLQFWPTPLV